MTGFVLLVPEENSSIAQLPNYVLDSGHCDLRHFVGVRCRTVFDRTPLSNVIVSSIAAPKTGNCVPGVGCVFVHWRDGIDGIELPLERFLAVLDGLLCFNMSGDVDGSIGFARDSKELDRTA